MLRNRPSDRGPFLTGSGPARLACKNVGSYKRTACRSVYDSEQCCLPVGLCSVLRIDRYYLHRAEMHYSDSWFASLAFTIGVLTDIVKAYPPSYHTHIYTRRADSAWNGQITPGSDTTQTKKIAFTPYWVPFGSSSIDDTDLLHVSYTPPELWSVDAESSYVGGTAHVAVDKGAEASIKFRGVSVEWYGTTSPDGGTAEVFLDGESVTAVSLRYGDRRQTQQMLFRRDGLSGDRQHTLKIINISEDSKASRIDIDAFVVQRIAGGKKRASSPSMAPQRMERRKRVPMSARLEPRLKTSATSGWSGTTRLAETGNSGINAMQFAVVSNTRALLVDKVEHNLLTVNGHPAWAAIYDFSSSPASGKARPLDISSNSFCAGGTWLSNGTLINVGGNPVTKDHTGSADFGDVNGLQAIRMLQPCEGEDCVLYEEPERIRMATARWYASVARLSDGSAFIMGGSTRGGWINNRCPSLSAGNRSKLMKWLELQTIRLSSTSRPRTSTDLLVFLYVRPS